MTYTPRVYEEIVRDLLTTLSGGTVRESLTVPVGEGTIVLPKLRDRPVRRVSHLQGVIQVGVGANTQEIPYKFTATDFELIATDGNKANKDAIRFREEGRRPVPGSTLTVNYYPVQTDPVPLTDLNVGSVARTLLETCGRELALSYLQLEHVYKSAFLESAEGSSLDKVVALVGVNRLPAGHPIVKVTFSRREGVPGQITIPVETPLTDGAGNRYLTLDTLTLEPYDTSREVLAGGKTAGTKLVDPGTLNRLEVSIAGISQVTNAQPARRLSTPETDDELRRRSRNALHGVVRGTVDALKFGLLSIQEVKNVTITEFPNGVPGELKIEVAYGDNSPAVKQLVARRIEELRPAGIRVISSEATRKRVNVRVELTLTGAGFPPATVTEMTSGVEGAIADYLTKLPPGGQARRSKLSTLALKDSRVEDAKVVLLPQGESEMEELTLATGEIFDVVRPFSFPSPQYADQPGVSPASTAIVSVILPIHLISGVTQIEATEAITLALESHLRTRQPDAPLNVDGLAAAIRDDTRFVLIRSDAIATIEKGGQFQQLTDGVGSYVPAQNETLQKGTVNLDVREGGV